VWNETYQLSTQFTASPVKGIIDIVPLRFLDEHCSPTSFVKFSTILTVELDSNSSLTASDDDEQLLQLSEAMLQSYNDLNLYNGRSCDPIGRQITSLRLESYTTTDDVLQDTNNDTNTTSFTFYVSGLCYSNLTNDCTVETNLFHIGDERRRRLQVQEEELTVVDTACLCPINGTVRRSPTQLEYQMRLQYYAPQVVQVQEMDPYVCSKDAQSSEEAFQTIIPIQFDVLCLLFEDDTPLLESAFLHVYNALAEDYYCDPIRRNVTNVTIVNYDSERVDGSSIRMELLIDGYCYGDGCSEDLIFFDVDKNSDEGRRRRHLPLHTGVEQEFFNNHQHHHHRRRLQSQCYCSTQSYDRGVTEIEFMVRVY
jgi:hypothetical protein